MGDHNAPVDGGQRLLVVGASAMREAAFAVWRQMGLEIVVADGYSAGRYEHLAHEFAPLDLDPDPRPARGLT